MYTSDSKKEKQHVYMYSFILMLGVLYRSSPTFQLATSHQAKSDSSALSENMSEIWKTGGNSSEKT